MKALFGEGMQRAICEFSGVGWKACEPWWESYVSPEALTNIFAAILGALIGAIAGGLVTFWGQSIATRRQERERLKERLLSFLLVTMRIVTDMRDVRLLIMKYRRETPENFELWQSVHTFQMKQNISPDLAIIEALTGLGSSSLVTKAMHVISEYGGLMNKIAIYDQMRTSFVSDRRNIQVTEPMLAISVTNLKNYVSFIDRTSEDIKEAEEVQRLLYSESRKHFGNVEFLTLDAGTAKADPLE
jgi:hypothetical protein